METDIHNNTEEISNIINNDSLSNRDKYKIIYGYDAKSRDCARYIINKLKDKYGFNNSKVNNQDKYPYIFKIKNNGERESSKIIKCSDEEIKNPDFLLRKHGFNTDDFELVNATSSIWQGGKNGENRFSSKITVRPINNELNIERLVKNAMLSLGDYIPKYSCGKANNDTSVDTLELCLADLHIGLTDLNGDFDFTRIIDAIDSSIEYIKNNKINNVIVAFLGDIFHYDTKGKTTTAGTQQDSLMSFQDAYSTASCILCHFMMELSVIGCNVDILYVPGNHDEILGYTLMNMLKQMFSNNINFHFDINQKQRKVKVIGNNLIGYMHGDMNQKNIMKWIYTDAKEYISKCNNIEIHAGHFHSEKVIEDGGVILRHMPSLSKLSPWENIMGYTHKQRMCGCLWGDNGLKSIVYF